MLESDTSKHIESGREAQDADNVKLKEVATAARVLQVSRNTQVSNTQLGIRTLAQLAFRGTCLCESTLSVNGVPADWGLGCDT